MINFFVTQVLGVRPKGRFDIRIGLPTSKERVKEMLQIKITNEQKVTVTLKPVTATGKPAPLDGKPTWTTQDGQSSVEVSEDGLSATLISSDNPGKTTVLLEADVDLGEGVETISEIIELEVLGAKASSFGVVVGEPEPK